MKNGNAYDLDIPAYIVHARDERGLSWRGIETDLWDVFKIPLDHTNVKRTYQRTAIATPATPDATKTQHPATSAETVAQAENKEAENAILDDGNGVAPVADVLRSVAFWSEWRAVFHPADLVFYGCVSIGCIGVAGALPVIGVAVAALWFCVAALFLHRTKMFARVGDIVTLALIEMLVGVPAHIAWANEALWQNVTALPIEIQLSYGGQMWTGRGIETPFFLACYCAGVLVFFGGAAVAVSTLAVQNSITIKNKAQ